MAQEVVLRDSNAIPKRKGDEIKAVTVKCKTITPEGKKPFNSVKAHLYLPYYKNGAYKGKRMCWVDLHFTRDAFDNINPECGVKRVDDLVTGTIYVKLRGLQLPSKYQVYENKKGENVYPEAWIKHATITDFEEFYADEEALEYHAPAIEAEEVEESPGVDAEAVADDEEMPWNKGE